METITVDVSDATFFQGHQAIINIINKQCPPMNDFHIVHEAKLPTGGIRFGCRLERFMDGDQYLLWRL